jgi:hypothetical protein
MRHSVIALLGVMLAASCDSRQASPRLDCGSVAPQAAQPTGPLSLDITVKEGVIKGVVRNASKETIKVNAQHLYGYWEFTTVMYFYGRWHEAPLIEKKRARIGTELTPVEIELQPGEMLTALKSDHIFIPKKTEAPECTFTIDLSEYELPNNHWDISEMRVVTCGLWSGIIKLKNPNKELKATE